MAAATTMQSHTLTETQARYFLTKSELEEFLQRKFGPQWDFEIRHANYRWKFKTPGTLEEAVVREWIDELQIRRQQANGSVPW